VSLPSLLATEVLSYRTRAFTVTGTSKLISLKTHRKNRGIMSLTCKKCGKQDTHDEAFNSVRWVTTIFSEDVAETARTALANAFRLKSGKLDETYTLPSRVTECGFAAANGQLFVSCEDGHLVCFEPKNSGTAPSGPITHLVAFVHVWPGRFQRFGFTNAPTWEPASDKGSGQNLYGDTSSSCRARWMRREYREP
jgi:hypothetical protein